MEIVRDLGEFGLLERVVSKYCSSARLGHFEDANLVRVKDIWLVNNTDSMPNHLPMPSVFHTEERDMFYEAGWTAVITTLNDLAVSGAQNYMSFSTRPIFHPELEIRKVESFTRGIADACLECCIEYTGGDTAIKGFFDGEGRSRLVECTTNAIGFLGPKHHYISRNTARPGDLISLTASSGVGWAKLIELSAVEFDFQNPQYSDFCRQHATELGAVEVSPKIPSKAFASCAREELLTSATDLSDGLMLIYATAFVPNRMGLNLEFSEYDLSEIAKDVCQRRGIHPINALLSEGLDAPNMHEITFRRENLKRVRELFRGDGREIYVIGQVTDQPSIVCTYEGGNISPKTIFADGSLDPERAKKSLVWYKSGDKSGD